MEWMVAYPKISVNAVFTQVRADEEEEDAGKFHPDQREHLLQRKREISWLNV